MNGWSAGFAVLLLCSLFVSGCLQPAAPMQDDGANPAAAPDPGSQSTGGTPAAQRPSSSASSSQESSAPSSSGSSSSQPPADQPAPPANKTGDGTDDSTTQVYAPRYDVLLQQTYLPVAAPFTDTFEVGPGYDVLDLSGRYDVPGGAFFVVVTDVTLKDGAGQTVVHYQGLPDGYAEFWFGGSTVSFTIGLVQHPTPGTYTLTVSTAGSLTGFDITAAGEAGGAPDFPYLDVTDSTLHQLHDLKGKAVVLDLMATWCGPCQDAMPGLGRIQKDYAGKARVVSISMDPKDTPAMILDMKGKYGGNWTFAFDTDGLARGHYDTGLFPSYAVIDHHGNLVFRSTGATEQDLRAWLDKGLAD
jgi:thiol-disulfide isomerase/thioredoxin